jgi:lipopolysaccharide/colanic/teichoic acid biosynthesis glycosyltransferase/2-polyprenyl-3-methyl-5-hydroxy-6-metoxy-1,4-benzoquinol methylase
MHYQFEPSALQRFQLLLKYGMDRVLAALLIVLAAPFLLLVAVAIKLDDHGSVFFRQDRLGRDAKRFKIWKFRTMVMNADRFLDESGGVTQNRITRTGRFLRSTSLDELPQLFNIVAGQMSFVGPRPVLPEHFDRYTEEQKGRFRVKPGVTGLAQIRGRNTLKWSERIQSDLEYIRSYSLWQDLKILLMTIGVVLTGSGVVMDRNADDVDDLGPPKSPMDPVPDMEKSGASESVCPVCDNPNSVPVASSEWTLFRCVQCEHVFSLDSGEPENTHFEGLDYKEWRAANKALLNKRARARMELVRKFAAPGDGRVFEIGCSTGELLQLFADAGWHACGVDLSEAAVSMCHESHPDVEVAVGTGPADLPGATQDPFDLVMAFHVVEHISDLSTLATSIGGYCREGGLLFVCVPNWGSWCRRVMGDQWPDLMREHLHYFTRASMSRWLAESGFELVHVETHSVAWPWLGGIRRKLRKLRSGSTQGNASAGMPGRLSMRILRAGEIVLWPLLRLETAFGAGNELRVIARRGTQENIPHS